MAQRKKLLLRLRPELWEHIQRWAADDFRSINGQIEFLLQRAVEERRRGRKVSKENTDDTDDDVDDGGPGVDGDPAT